MFSYHIYYILQGFAFAALFIATNISASSDLSGMSAMIRWRNSAGSQSRDFNIKKDGTIMESHYDTSEYVWKSKDLPFRAYPNTPIFAAFIGPAKGDPERIQLFYNEDDNNTMSSIVWTELDGWRHDAAFVDKGFRGFVGTAVAWKDSQDVQNIYVYTYNIIPLEGGEDILLHNRTTIAVGSQIHEIRWTSEKGWVGSTEEEPILTSNVAIPFKDPRHASVSGDRDMIRFDYWNRSSDVQEDPKNNLPMFHEAVWTPSDGWNTLAKMPYWVSPGDPRYKHVQLSDEDIEKFDRIRDSGYL